MISWQFSIVGIFYIYSIYTRTFVLLFKKYCGFLRHLPRIISGECKDGHLASHWESHSIRIFALFPIIAEFYLTYLGLIWRMYIVQMGAGPDTGYHTADSYLYYFFIYCRFLHHLPRIISGECTDG